MSYADLIPTVVSNLTGESTRRLDGIVDVRIRDGVLEVCHREEWHQYENGRYVAGGVRYVWSKGGEIGGAK